MLRETRSRRARAEGQDGQTTGPPSRMLARLLRSGLALAFCIIVTPCPFSPLLWLLWGELWYLPPHDAPLGAVSRLPVNLPEAPMPPLHLLEVHPAPTGPHAPGREAGKGWSGTQTLAHRGGAHGRACEALRDASIVRINIKLGVG